jgi:hypothetical protein
MVLDGQVFLYTNSGALITKCTILTKLNTYPPNYTESPSKTNVKRRSKTVLSPEEIPESLKVEIQSLKEFCTKLLNPLAGGHGMSNGPANKLIETLLSFMFLCSKVKNKLDLIAFLKLSPLFILNNFVFLI